MIRAIRFETFVSHRWMAGMAMLALAMSGCTSMTQRDGDPAAADLAPSPSVSNAELRQQASRLLADGKARESLAVLAVALEADPADVESLFAAAAIHERLGEREAAVSGFEHVLELQPQHAYALLGLGLVQFDLRHYDESKLALARAIEVDPALWRAHNTLGIIADMEERHAAAIEHYGSAMALRPAMASLANNRGYSKYLAGDWAAAEQDFAKAIELDAEYGRAWHNFGLVRARQGDYTSAMRAIQRAAPKHVAANDVGYIAMLNGDFAAAEAYFQEAILQAPQYYATAQSNMAALRRQQSTNIVVADQE